MCECDAPGRRADEGVGAGGRGGASPGGHDGGAQLEQLEASSSCVVVNGAVPYFVGVRARVTSY